MLVGHGRYEETSFCFLLMPGLLAVGPTPQTIPTLKGILLDQLRTTRNKKGTWFVPLNVALAGLTAEEAKWKERSGNHSLMELTEHLLFWDERNLTKFKGEQSPRFGGNNDETFETSVTWDATVQKLDSVLTDWEKSIEVADDQKLNRWYPTIAYIGAHNAYDLGQIVYIRKLQGSWNPANGVQ